MNNVLLVLPADADAPKAVDHALDEAARRNAGVVVLVLLDDTLATRVTSTLANVGFVGDKVCGSVSETLAREQRAHADRLLERLGAEARLRGVAFTGIVEEGELGEVCAPIARAHDVDLVVLVGERRSLLGRFLSRSAAAKLPSLAGCEVKLIEE